MVLTHQSRYLPWISILWISIQLIFSLASEFQTTSMPFWVYFSPSPNEEENYLVMWSGHWWKKWHIRTMSFYVFGSDSCHITSLLKWTQRLWIHINNGGGWSGVETSIGLVYRLASSIQNDIKSGIKDHTRLVSILPHIPLYPDKPISPKNPVNIILVCYSISWDTR